MLVVLKRRLFHIVISGTEFAHVARPPRPIPVSDWHKISPPEQTPTRRDLSPSRDSRILDTVARQNANHRAAVSDVRQRVGTLTQVVDAGVIPLLMDTYQDVANLTERIRTLEHHRLPQQPKQLAQPEEQFAISLNSTNTTLHSGSDNESIGSSENVRSHEVFNRVQSGLRSENLGAAQNRVHHGTSIADEHRVHQQLLIVASNGRLNHDSGYSHGHGHMNGSPKSLGYASQSSLELASLRSDVEAMKTTLAKIEQLLEKTLLVCPPS